MRVAVPLIAVLALAGCANLPQPVVNPCGVLNDDLGNIHATTVGGEKRLDEHFERGVQAGCWDRSGASKPDLTASRIRPQVRVVEKPVYRTHTQRVTLVKPVERVVEKEPDNWNAEPGVIEPAVTQNAEEYRPTPISRAGRWFRFFRKGH